MGEAEQGKNSINKKNLSVQVSESGNDSTVGMVARGNLSHISHHTHRENVQTEPLKKTMQFQSKEKVFQNPPNSNILKELAQS